MGRVTGRRRTLRLRVVADAAQGQRVTDSSRVDVVAVEEPLELRLGGSAYVTTMRTPGHDLELAHGLLHAEGVIHTAADVLAAQYCAGKDESTGENSYNVLALQLAPGVQAPERSRATLMSSACGVCGSASIDDVRQRSRFDLRTDTTAFDPALLVDLPNRLRRHQPVFDRTGGVHAAGLFDAYGSLLVAREDVGRHNAVDKVIGWALLAGLLPLRGQVLTVSGRASFELVQKAVLAGIPALVSVSAPSSLAIDVAAANHLTLMGFTRGESANVYAGAQRLIGHSGDL